MADQRAVGFESDFQGRRYVRRLNAKRALSSDPRQ